MAAQDNASRDEARARTASAEEIPRLLSSPDPAVLLALVENPELNEQHAEILLRRADLPPAVLAALATHPALSASYAVRRDIVLHPHAPRLVALRWVRQLYLFDLVRLTLLPSAHAELKRIAEDTLVARLPQVPQGQKLTLARRASGRVAAALLAEGVPPVVRLALDNPFLAEGHLLQLLARDELASHVVTAIAEHPRWVRLPGVRLALVRHPATPSVRVRALLPDLALHELRDLLALGRLRPERRQMLEQEIARRAPSGRPR
ncbi:MAG: hypothetical protein K6U09_03265 [Acidobacteriia bacterium]|jgi:hypothetical protein|nr:hypothetical protein [Terriglobia bacterium]